MVRFESFESGQGRGDRAGSPTDTVSMCVLLVRFEDFCWCASRVWLVPFEASRVVAIALAHAFRIRRLTSSPPPDTTY